MTVTVYGKPNCVQCAATERTLIKQGITFNKIDITEDQDAYDYVVSLGHRSAPVVVVDQDNWSGFRPEKLAALVA
jgi:glutaredoxin-like protein NrdH